MENYKLLLWLVLLSFLSLIILLLFYYNQVITNTNEKLKRETYQLKKKCEKLEDEKLKLILSQ